MPLVQSSGSSFTREEWGAFMDAVRAIAGDGTVRVTLQGSEGSITGSLSVGPDGTIRLSNPEQSVALTPDTGALVTAAAVDAGPAALDRYVSVMEAGGVTLARVWGAVYQAAELAGRTFAFQQRYAQLEDSLRRRESSVLSREHMLNAQVAHIMQREGHLEVAHDRMNLVAELQQRNAEADLYAVRTRGNADMDAQRVQYSARLRATQRQLQLKEARVAQMQRDSQRLNETVSRQKAHASGLEAQLALVTKQRDAAERTCRDYQSSAEALSRELEAARQDAENLRGGLSRAKSEADWARQQHARELQRVRDESQRERDELTAYYEAQLTAENLTTARSAQGAGRREVTDQGGIAARVKQRRESATADAEEDNAVSEEDGSSDAMSIGTDGHLEPAQSARTAARRPVPPLNWGRKWGAAPAHLAGNAYPTRDAVGQQVAGTYRNPFDTRPSGRALDATPAVPCRETTRDAEIAVMREELRAVVSAVQGMQRHLLESSEKKPAPERRMVERSTGEINSDDERPRRVHQLKVGLPNDCPVNLSKETYGFMPVRDFTSFVRQLDNGTVTETMNAVSVLINGHARTFNLRRAYQLLYLWARLWKEPTEQDLRMLGWELYAYFREYQVLGASKTKMDLEKLRRNIYGDAVQDMYDHAGQLAAVGRCKGASGGGASSGGGGAPARRQLGEVAVNHRRFPRATGRVAKPGDRRRRARARGATEMAGAKSSAGLRDELAQAPPRDTDAVSTPGTAMDCPCARIAHVRDDEQHRADACGVSAAHGANGLSDSDLVRSLDDCGGRAEGSLCSERPDGPLTGEAAPPERPRAAIRVISWTGPISFAEQEDSHSLADDGADRRGLGERSQ